MMRRLEGVAGYLAAVDTPAPGPISHENSFFRACPARSREGRGLGSRRFLWSQVQAIAAAMINAWLKRKGLE